MKHKHEKWIHLMADGVRIERKKPSGWVKADLCCFDWTNVEFRISPNQPADTKKWRWMYAVADNMLYMTPPMTEAEVKAWAAERPSGYKLGPRQDWTEVECDE